MSKKNFIGGGFPGIRECIDEKNVLTKESIEKREFSIKKIISINNILKNKNTNTNMNNNLEYLNVKDAIQYNSIENFLHNPQVMNSNINTDIDFDINMINKPIKKKKKNK
jgi:hypothetical protein